jgi:hypothetical protein
MTEDNSINLLPEIYYKITNKNEKHFEYQYKDGLNILDKEFGENEVDDSLVGGLYFTDKENIHNFLNHGIFIREIRLPTNAKCIKFTGILDTYYRSNMLYLGKKYDMYSKEALALIPEEFKKHYFNGLWDNLIIGYYSAEILTKNTKFIISYKSPEELNKFMNLLTYYNSINTNKMAMAKLLIATGKIDKVLANNYD